MLDCAASAAVDVKQKEGSLGFRAAQLELSCSHQSECQDGAEQQEGQGGRERESLRDDTYAKIPNVLKVSEMNTEISQPENILSSSPLQRPF